MSLVARAGLLSALWIGMVAGTLEVTIVAFRRLVLGRLVFVGSDFWWLAPLVAAALVAVPTAVLATPFPRRWARLGPRLRYGVPLALGSFGLVSLLPGLARSAAVLLALGVAIRGGAWLVRRTVGFERLVRRTLPALLLLPVLGGAGLSLTRYLREFRGSSSSSDSPNILLIVLDTVRAMELGLYGFTPTTSPNLDGFAADGVVFDNAFATAPWTAPSHASFFTGRRVHELSIDWEAPLDRTFPTLAETLRGVGYVTVGMVANTLYASAETGLARGFDRYEDSQLGAGHLLHLTKLGRALTGFAPGSPAPEDAGRISATDITRRFLSWVRHRPRRPFFAFLNYYDAHGPYFPPEPYWSRYLGGQVRRPLAIIPGDHAPPSVALRRRAYDGAIAYLDDQLGTLFDSLLARRVLDNTLVIIVGDHGEEFLEHGLMGHGNSLYGPSLHVPLVMVWRGHLPEGRRVSEPVSLASIPATILELIGRDGPFPSPSFAGLWAGQAPANVAVTSAVTFARNLPRGYPVSAGPLASAMLGRYRYIRGVRDTIGQLYNHQVDLLETRNLAGEPWAGSIVAQLRDTVRATSPTRRWPGKRLP